MSFLFDEAPAPRKTREAALGEMPAELQAEMIGQLSSPHLLRWLVEGIEQFGVAGEHRLALIVYLTGTSRLLSSPLAAIVQGPSSSGKSYVIEKVAELFPAEAVLVATDITPNALYYLAPGELNHRFVVAGERSRRQNDETAQGTKALREMISAGQLRKLIAIADPDGPKTSLIEQEGPIAYVESTTAPELFEEDSNRCLILQPDERPEQTRRILAATGRRLTGESGPREQLRQRFHCLHRLLQPWEVVIPFADRLAELFPSEPLEVRRAFRHVTSMIQSIGLLHQYQRQRDDQGRIVAQAEDYWLARFLLKNCLAQSLGQKPADALRRFVEQLRKFTGEQTAKELSQAMKISERTVREHLQTLLTNGVVEQSSPASGPIPARWMIRADIALPAPEDDLLPTVEDACGISDLGLELPELPADWASANSTDVPF